MEKLIKVIFELTTYLLHFNSLKNFPVFGFPLLAAKPIRRKQLEVMKRTKSLENLITLAEKYRDAMLIVYS